MSPKESASQVPLPPVAANAWSAEMISANTVALRGLTTPGPQVQPREDSRRLYG